MKQKIVIKVNMNCDECRTKAKKIAATACGVTSVALEAAKDQIVVVGEEVDSVKLAKSLRKKVGHAVLMSVQEEKDKGKDEKKEDDKKPTLYCYPQPPPYAVVCESNPDSCTVL
ncbi:heavy metal-associated isoprenylated plant protein 47 [Populus alba]|nr:heavy metal-associated isoprenylated plant protein 47-like [Populus alba]KAJ7015405.1 heavy metal-associated isoprenylated plant protein 47-like [Populus alba x Populus x berolinensis]